MDHLTSITKNGSSTLSDLPVIQHLFSWPSLKMESNTSCSEYFIVDRDEIQTDPPEKVLLVEKQKDFDFSNYFCQAYGGRLYVPENDNDLQKVTSLLQQSENCTHSYLGLKKSSTNGVVDLQNNVVSFVKWGKNQPNGKSYQQCIQTYFNGYDYIYGDEKCSEEVCFVCQVPSKNTFKLRGNGISSSTERDYFVQLGTRSKDTEIRGFKETNCFWNGTTWIFGQHLKLDIAENNMLPPVGAKQWNDNQILKFTQCKEDQFTCHSSGNCISMDKRCDGHLDCPEDSSDENECNIMTLSKGYDKKYPSKKNTTIFIALEVIDIVEINELNMDFTADIKVALKWFDSRITFRNLASSHLENQLSIREIDTIWTPELVFLHSNEIHIKAGEQSEGKYGTVRVHQEGLPKQNDVTEIDEDYLYPGFENPILMVNYFVVKLGCKFNLSM